MLLDIFGQLGPKELGCVALASKAAYCFANQEDLWKSLVIEVGARRPAADDLGMYVRTELERLAWQLPRQSLRPPTDPLNNSRF